MGGGGVVTAQRKQDEHVHEISLPDGIVVTGPPIAAVPAIPEDVPEPPLPPKALRKASVVADPEAAFAEERMRAHAAASLRDKSKLPEHGSMILDRMRRSAIRFAGDGKAEESYADELAWRAVRQHYGIGEFAPGAKRAEAAKSSNSGGQGTNSEAQGSNWPRQRSNSGALVIPLTKTAPVDLARFGRVVTRTVPGSGGVQVRLGLRPEGRTLIDVTLPGSLVGSGDSARKTAAEWVTKNWAAVRAAAYAGPGHRPPQVFHVEQAPRLRWLRHSKIYHRTPEKATERIAYGVVYPAWEVDLQGQYATADEVTRMAHAFLQKRGAPGEMHARWVMPDGSPAGEVVESFITRPRDPDFAYPGDWVVGTKYHPEVWKGILSGKYRGLSIGGEWTLRPLDVRMAGVLEEAA